MKKVIVIVGPTAIGKTKISVELAKKLNLDIINGDSVSIYKKLDIGSAKVTKEEMDSVKHYLVDTVDPKTEYSTSHFQEDARGIIEKNNPIIIAGGTGLYISSVIYDYDFSAKPRDDKFMEQFSTYPNYELYKYLESIDPEFDQEKIHINNRKRVLRAIEIKMTTGESISKNANKNKPFYESYIVYLNIDNRELLYDRINKRVDLMFESGLEKEVRELYDSGIKKSAIGYSEFYPYFEGKEDFTLEVVKENIKKNSRHLAKRQITWFKNQMDTHFYNVDLVNIDNTVETIFSDLKEFIGE